MMCSSVPPEASDVSETQHALGGKVHGPDPVQSWNEQTLTTIRLRRAIDAEAARALAMVNVAMYDAINGIDTRCGRADRKPALVAPDDTAPDEANEAAAAAAAAHAVLVALYPDHLARFDAALEADLAPLGTGKRVKAGRRWGASVGEKVVRARENDGSAPHEVQPSFKGVGKFPLAWGGVQYRNLEPFAIANPDQYISPGPPALGTLDYAAAFAEVKLLGNAAIPDPEKNDIFQYWSLAAGTVQPPGEWVKIGLTVANAREMELNDKARLFALLSMALADTVAPTFKTKFIYSHWRPAHAVAQASEDENPHTDSDLSWRPRAGGAGGTPEHTSGHSSFSAAGAAVLAGFFCDDNIAFSHVSDSSMGGVARSYPGFSAAAAEAGRSRVLGGIHFEFSNQVGLAAGRNIAQEVLSRMLLRNKGKKHFGQCPL
jgi:PAP2 superfamily